MGNICDCLSNDSDAEGLVPPVTRDSRYGGLRDPVPATLPPEVVTSVSATEFSSIPPNRPVAEVHPQTHVASSSPKPSAAAAFPPTTVTPPAGADIEKVTLPPPPVKSPVKKTSKEGPAIVPRPKAEPVMVDDPLVDVPRFQIKGSGGVTDEPVYAEIQANALSVDSAPPTPARRPDLVSSTSPISQPIGPADDESFAEFVKDRTKSGGSVDTPIVTPNTAAPIYATPAAVAPKPAASPPASVTPIDSPLTSVTSTEIIPTPAESATLSSSAPLSSIPLSPTPLSPTSASPTPATLPASDPCAVDVAPSLPSASVGAKEQRTGSGDFTEYLDKAVAQTKKTIAETAVVPKQPEDDVPLVPVLQSTSLQEEEMNTIDLDANLEKSRSPDDFEAQLAATNADIEKVPVQNSFKQMSEILTIPGTKEKTEKESSPFEIGSSESEFSKPDLTVAGKSLAEELSEFSATEVDTNDNEILKTPLVVGVAQEAEALSEDRGALFDLAISAKNVGIEIENDGETDSSLEAAIAMEVASGPMIADDEAQNEEADISMYAKEPVIAVQADDKVESAFTASALDADVDLSAMAPIENADAELDAYSSEQGKVLQNPAVIDAVELELTNEDSPRIIVGDSMMGDLNVTEVFSHENVRISHSSPECVVSAAEEVVAKEPALDLQEVINEGTGDVEAINEKELRANADKDEALRSEEVFSDIPPMGQDLLDIDSRRDAHAVSYDESNNSFDINATAASLDASGTDLVDKELLFSSKDSAASVVVANHENEAIIATVDAKLESSVSTVESAVEEISFDTETAFETTSSATYETPSFEKSVDHAANYLVDDILQASTEEMAASAIVADIGADAANQLAAANIADNIASVAIKEVAALQESPEPSDQNSSESKLESSIEILQSTPEKASEDIADPFDILISSPSKSAAALPDFDEIDSWLTSSAGDKGAVPASDGGAAGATAGESSDEFIIISKEEEEIQAQASGEAAAVVIADLPEVHLIGSELDFAPQDFPQAAQTQALDDQLLLRAEQDAHVGSSPVASVDSAFEDVLADDAAGLDRAAIEGIALHADINDRNALQDTSDSYDAATPTVEASTPTQLASISFAGVNVTTADAVAAAAANDDDSDDETFDDDEFAKIMATAKKIDAKAKERGDSDPSSAPVGLTFSGPGGDDNFLERLAKKISKDSESEETHPEPQPTSSHDDTLGSELSTSATDKTGDATDSSFFSAKSEVTLTEEPSFAIDGIDDALSDFTPAKDDASAVSNGHTLSGNPTELVGAASNDAEDVYGDGAEGSEKTKKKNSRRRKKKGTAA